MKKTIRTFRIKLSYLPVFYRLVRHSQQPFGKKFEIGKKYYEVYVYQKVTQIQKMHTAIQQLKNNKKQSQYFSQIKKNLKNYSQILQEHLKQKKTQMELNSTKQNYQKQVKGIMYRVMEYLSLYYESLQQLVQGRREVLNDSKYKFDDGESVEKKKQRFEQFFKKTIGNLSQSKQ